MKTKLKEETEKGKKKSIALFEAILATQTNSTFKNFGQNNSKVVFKRGTKETIPTKIV
jgi:hypothetical protein